MKILGGHKLGVITHIELSSLETDVIFFLILITIHERLKQIGNSLTL